MPSNMSFLLTTEQVRHQSKDVTRRLGWKKLQPGAIINACVKCMGLAKGEKVDVICQIRIVSVRREPLCRMVHDLDYGRREVVREGFPEMSPAEFVEMFCSHMKCSDFDIVTRIEFEYLEGLRNE